MRDKKSKKKERRKDSEEIKIKIQPSQLQTSITFDSKLYLRRTMRP
jgi:hypothetical protein